MKNENTNLRVAIQGFEGSFHHIVAHNYFGKTAQILPCSTFKQVADSVSNSTADVAVMAIENSIAGSILSNYKILQDKGLKVVGEYYLGITQNLMALPGTKIEDVKQVRSHPIALLQCMDYLETRNWELLETEDTALSAKHVSEQSLKGVAAVAGDLAAQLFGLEIIKPQINTITNNQTRFLILSRIGDTTFDENKPNKASLYVKLPHKEGTLFDALKIIKDNRLNMSMLQSCPVPKNPFTYLFHLGVEFDDVMDFLRATQQLQAVVEELHIYGIYKKGNHEQ